MKFAINTHSILAVRSEADYCTEMTSQILFGEYCTILGETKNYYQIENFTDKHIGWVAKNGLEIINQSIFEELTNEPVIRVCVPIADVFCTTDKTIHRIPMGSLITSFDAETSKFEIGSKAYQIHPSFVSYLPEANLSGIVPIALSMLNAPYLNGGKTLMGVDCSGFVQMVYSVNGIVLPRFSSEQSKIGTTISNLSDAEAGDLFFFSADNVPSHTGIYLGNNRVIHAADTVRIDSLDDNGDYVDSITRCMYKKYKITRVGI